MKIYQKLLLWVGIAVCVMTMLSSCYSLYASAPAPQRVATKVPKQSVAQLCENISLSLRDAVDNANLCVSAPQRMRAEGELKKKDAAELIRNEQLTYRQKCLTAIQDVQKYLCKLRIYVSPENYQNMHNVSVANMVPAFVADRSVSSYLENVAVLGLDRLREDLNRWTKHIEKDRGIIIADDIEHPTQLYDKAVPDLMSCALFWRQLQHSASPCFQELLELFKGLGALKAQCSVWSAAPMSFIQRGMHISGLEPAKDTRTRRATDYFGLTSKEKSKNTMPLSAARCIHLYRDIDIFLQQARKVDIQVRAYKKNIEPGLFLINKSFKEKELFQLSLKKLQDLRHELKALQICLISYYKDQRACNAVYMQNVTEVLDKSVASLRTVDQFLRDAGAGISRIAGLTGDQRRDLENISSRQPIFSVGSLNSAITNFIETIKSALPAEENLELYLANLAKSIDEFERKRGRPFVHFNPPEVVEHASESRIIKFFSLGHIADCIEWIASIGGPTGVSHIANAAGAIHEGVVRIETARALFHRQLSCIRNAQDRFMPMSVLGDTRDDKTLPIVMGGDFYSRYREIMSRCKAAVKHWVEEVIATERAPGYLESAHAVVSYMSVMGQKDPDLYSTQRENGILDRMRVFYKECMYKTKTLGMIMGGLSSYNMHDIPKLNDILVLLKQISGTKELQELLAKHIVQQRKFNIAKAIQKTKLFHSVDLLEQPRFDDVFEKAWSQLCITGAWGVPLANQKDTLKKLWQEYEYHYPQRQRMGVSAMKVMIPTALSVLASIKYEKDRQAVIDNKVMLDDYSKERKRLQFALNNTPQWKKIMLSGYKFFGYKKRQLPRYLRELYYKQEAFISNNHAISLAQTALEDNRHKCHVSNFLLNCAQEAEQIVHATSNCKKLISDAHVALIKKDLLMPASIALNNR